jgi:hypothetical protein
LFNARLRSRDLDGQSMIPGNIFAWLPMLLGILGFQHAPPGTAVSRLIVEDEIILRVRMQSTPVMPEIDWVEHNGVKCIPIDRIRGALLSGPAQIDFIMADHNRIRAHIDAECPALDFYGNFYLQPQDDRLCVRRDAIHSRMGGSCMIEQFRRLVPKVRR